MHYLALIQEARRTAETLVAQRPDLPADLVERQAARARENLTAGLEALAALPPHALRGGLAGEMADRAESALALLDA